ncbi:uncharacterized protein N7473_005999 [Penicillium subrubescens]|uniref:uncharacterized protein n=1 Tax=Penicillium subrubescens TaxID=1316194 RepID=UPI0025456DCC|nr:uncharacterized protein N7473_005999 [Penicillium subrubescens]KAJ5896600.1 hypothetical protein N7473_005999 [Penicillium subrubescens]
MSQSQEGISSTRATAKQERSVMEIDQAFERGNLIVIFGSMISICALKCSTARDKTGDEKMKMAKNLSWKSFIMNGFEYLETNHPEALDESEIRELQRYRECLPSRQVNIGTMLQAAAFLKSKLGEIDDLQRWLDLLFKNLYEDFIGNGPNEVLDSIKMLYDSNKRVQIITTSYDDLISRHCKASTILPSEEKKLWDFFSDSIPWKSILHTHGIWSEGSGAVLDGINYFETRAPVLQQALKSCLRGPKTLLFVGTGQGLEDPNFTSLLNWAEQETRDIHQRHYVLVADADGEQPGRGQVLEPIKYGHYSQLPLWLTELAQKSDKNYTPHQEPFIPPGLPVSDEFVDVQSETDTKDTIINDRTQYRDYYLRKNLGWKMSNERRSFPISCRSEEAKAFENTVTALEKDLSDHNIRWTSIDCIGRSEYGTADPIKSTILITVPPGHSPDYKSQWKCEWNNKKFDLNIEIMNGGIEQECFGNAKQKMDPLACGSSCGSLSQPRRTGTIGGFINLTTSLNDQEDKPVYAMSCHHVFAPDQPRVKWGNAKIRRLFDMVYELGGRSRSRHESQDKITILSNWMKVAFAFREGECLEVFKVLSRIAAERPPNPGQISFMAHLFLKRFCQRIRQLGSKYDLEVDSETLNRLEPQIDGILSGLQLRFRLGPKMLERDLFASSRLPQNSAIPLGETHIYNALCNEGDIAYASNPLTSKGTSAVIPRKLLNLFDLDTVTSSGDQFSSLEDIHCFSEEPLALWINTWNKRDAICEASSCYIDHPSTMDRVATRQNLEHILTEYGKWAGTSSLPVSPELMPELGVANVSDKFIRAAKTELDKSGDVDDNRELATIGAISVSSGLDAKPDPFDPHTKMEWEDWALAKLLPFVECRNFLDHNVLAPSSLQKDGQEVFAVRSWKEKSEWDRLKVYKRGRTTDYTVGIVHGRRRSLEAPHSAQGVATHVIVSDDPESPFSKRGDSGSWVIDSHGLLVGMIWGKSDFDDTTYFTPADYIFRYIPKRIADDGGPEGQVCKILHKIA